MSVSEITKKLQHLLNLLGASPKLAEDGDYGPKSTSAYELAVAKYMGGSVGEDTSPPPPPVVAPNDGEAMHWKPGPFHPIFTVPAPFTHLHPLDFLKKFEGEKEIPGSKDNPLIAHTHEHSGNLGTHSEGADYHDEVPHCSSGLNWTADGCRCYKSNNALASSWDNYQGHAYKKGDVIKRGAIVRIKQPGGNHVTMADQEFVWDSNGSFVGFGANQGNSYKASSYHKAYIVTAHDWAPKPGTVLAPIGTISSLASGDEGESTK